MNSTIYASTFYVPVWRRSEEYRTQVSEDEQKEEEEKKLESLPSEIKISKPYQLKLVVDTKPNPKPTRKILSLENVATDILELIVGFLPFLDLLRLNQVSKNFRYLANDPKNLNIQNGLIGFSPDISQPIHALAMAQLLLIATFYRYRPQDSFGTHGFMYFVNDESTTTNLLETLSNVLEIQSIEDEKEGENYLIKKDKKERIIVKSIDITEISAAYEKIQESFKVLLVARKENIVTQLEPIDQEKLYIHEYLYNFPFPVASLKSLRELAIVKSGLTFVPDNFNFPCLEKLNLCDNEISFFPRLRLPNLRFLDLSDNYLVEFPQLDLPLLETLCLEKNKISQISESITSLTSLTMLNLTENRISSIPDHMSRLNSLKVLNIRDNYDYQQFPLVEMIINMPNLKKVVIGSFVGSIKNGEIDAESIRKEWLQNSHSVEIIYC